MDVRSQLIQAQLEQRATSPTKKSEIIYNTVSDKVEYFAASTAKVVVSENDTQTLTNKSINADQNTITNIENADIKAGAGIDLSKLAATTASRALVSDGSGVISPSAVTSTQLGYLSTTTSDVQTQLDAKIAKSTFTTKGDILATSGASTPTRLAVGANNTVLIADSAEATGVKWGSISGLTNLAVVTKTSAYTVTTADDVILVDATSASFTLTLYTAVGNSGKQIIVKKTTSTNLVTIDPNSTETIDGDSTKVMDGNGEVYVLVSDGSNWQVRAFFSSKLLTATSSVKTATGANNYHQMTGNSVTLTKGSWQVNAAVAFLDNGTTPAYTTVGLGVFGANGADTVTIPTSLASTGNLTVDGALYTAGLQTLHLVPSSSSAIVNGPTIYVTVTTSVTIYSVPFSNHTTSANTRITTYLNARKIK